jgi:3'(2'), 5'-bisphosphate nucleotidase
MNKARAHLLDVAAAADLIGPLTELVIRAGAAILAVDRSAMKVDGKLDGSPVTEADPLDGTKEFVAGRNEFTVNLALVTEGKPLLGIVGAPGLGLVWRGLVGRGAERLTIVDMSVRATQRIRTRRCPPPGKPWTVAVSRSHGDARTEAFIERRPGAVRAELGSAVKFGRVAEGAADIYPRLSPTSEWDVAAGHAVVTAAGGKVTDSKGAELHFGLGRENFIVPEFIAWGDPAAAA